MKLNDHCRKLRCEVCNATHPHVRALVIHRATEHYHNDVESCKFCDNVILKVNGDTMERHLRGCAGLSKELLSDIPFKIKCNICDRTLMYNKLHTHVAHCHFDLLQGRTGFKSGDQVSCSVCNELVDVFSYASHLQKKIARGSKSIGKFMKCAECNEQWTYNQLRPYHEVTHISSVRDLVSHKWSCNMCEEVSTTFGDCLLHKHICVARRRCKYCRLRFSNVKDGATHEKNCDGGFKCKICDMVFEDTYALKHHVVVHNNHDTYNCNLCNCGYYEKSNFSRHLTSNRHRRNERSKENH